MRTDEAQYKFLVETIVFLIIFRVGFVVVLAMAFSGIAGVWFNQRLFFILKLSMLLPWNCS